MSKMHEKSSYGKDYKNWGKIKQKLVLGRPKERYYPKKFHPDSIQSHYARENNRVQDAAKKMWRENSEKYR